ncbi:MAG: ATP-binding cassette domain-containing protein [Bacteroidota bacterium]
MIRLQEVSKSFGTKKVLKGIDLTFEVGKVYGIVGANGAGKTTLFRCIAGLESYEGLVTSDKVPLKNHLGFLATNPYFFPKITGWEYLQLFCQARGISNTDFDTKNLFQLPLKEYAVNYSTGMKKKLALTAILLQQNDYFILDEPFNGVDIQSNLLITELIKKLKSLGKTILIASHIFATLQETCDAIKLLENGQIVKQVLPQEFRLLEAEMKDFTIGDSINSFLN